MEKRNMIIFAHRGLKVERPENTLEAFQAAHAAGFGIELDVRLTKDGDLVCIHDSDPARVAGPSAITDVRNHTVAELQQLNVATVVWWSLPPARIPRFANVADQVIARFVPGKQCAAIHVKVAEQGDLQLRMIADAFRVYNLYDKAIVFDLTLESAARVRALDPRIKIFISVGEERFGESILLWEDLEGHEDLYDGVWWDEWGKSRKAGLEYTAERALEIKAKGKLIYAISPELHWEHGHPNASIGYTQQWEQFIVWEIDGVCTAFPYDFRKIQAEMQQAA